MCVHACVCARARTCWDLISDPRVALRLLSQLFSFPTELPPYFYSLVLSLLMISGDHECMEN